MPEKDRKLRLDAAKSDAQPRALNDHLRDYWLVVEEPAPAFTPLGAPLFGTPGPGIALFGILLLADEPPTVVGSAGGPAGALEVPVSPAVPAGAFPIEPPGALPAAAPMDPPVVEGEVMDPVLLPGALVVPPPD